MTKKLTIIALALCIVAGANAQEKKEEVMTKEKGGTYVIRTETICDALGYKKLGKVPLVVTVKKDKIVSVEAQPNKETPKYFLRVANDMLPKYAGIKFADHAAIDGVTGATLSSNAVKENMKAAFEYYKKNK